MAGPFCPIYTLSAEKGELEDCYERKCAWWYEHKGACSIVQLVEALYNIRWELVGIKGRLPKNQGG